MREQKLQNEEIHRIGDKVLNAVRLPDSEVDKIVFSPHLFDAVLAATRSQGSAAGSKTSSKLAVGWRWSTAVAACAAVVLLAIAAVQFIRFADPSVSPTDTVLNNEQRPVTADLREPDKAIVESSLATQATAVRNNVARPLRTERASKTKHRPARRTARPEDEAEPEKFQLLTYAGLADETDGEGQIVRVELPRESLFAMGVDIPVEIESATVKTDLLIGSDGVTRGVRIVKAAL